MNSCLLGRLNIPGLARRIASSSPSTHSSRLSWLSCFQLLGASKTSFTKLMSPGASPNRVDVTLNSSERM